MNILAPGDSAGRAREAIQRKLKIPASTWTVTRCAEQNFPPHHFEKVEAELKRIYDDRSTSQITRRAIDDIRPRLRFLLKPEGELYEQVLRMVDSADGSEGGKTGNALAVHDMHSGAAATFNGYGHSPNPGVRHMFLQTGPGPTDQIGLMLPPGTKLELSVGEGELTVKVKASGE